MRDKGGGGGRGQEYSKREKREGKMSEKKCKMEEEGREEKVREKGGE